jgi:hypothetical protein
VFAVEYMLEFEGLWNGTHVEGGTLPGGAHFTTLIGATHDAGDPLWEAGGMATPGIEKVAELGSTPVLSIEIQARITAGSAGEEITASSINSFPTTTQSTFEIEVDDPNATLISMVAPSPDWFVGVSDVSLRSGDSWVQALTVDLHPYDAGTEEGSGFSLSNPATDPQEPITLINGSPFVGSPLIGRLHFTLLTPQVTPLPLLSSWAVLLLGGLMVGSTLFVLAGLGRAPTPPQSRAASFRSDGCVPSSRKASDSSREGPRRGLGRSRRGGLATRRLRRLEREGRYGRRGEAGRRAHHARGPDGPAVERRRGT